ncbi:uncharacterized protein LOC115876547 [Sitophilus oryzae]|uniref:Uncharacterized protein LOC115876547 n=1 Tax=Sitophilus oryzae TaxID=7048 RepID=A0A6J2XAC6_SITOR|nr:uncharacterized protein LOC115876547 [Sitophilus oryzae]
MPSLYSLTQYLNSTLKLDIYDSHGYGNFVEYVEGKQLKVLVKGILDNDIDIGGALFINHERLRAVRYSGVLNLLGIKFFLKKPPLSYVKNIYVLTLTKQVWFATFLITFLFLVALYIALRWERTSWTNYEENIMPENQRSVSVSDMVLLSLEALCQQGTYIEPVTLSARILMLWFFLFFMFIFVAYSASILILLRSAAEIRSISDLLNNKFEVGALNVHFMKHYLSKPKHGPLRELYIKKIYPNNYFSIEDGFRKIQKEHFAYFTPIAHASLANMRNYTNYDICAFQELAGYIDDAGVTRTWNCPQSQSAHSSKASLQ